MTRWVGESALLPCVSEGFPVPESTWFRVESPGGSLRQVLPSPRVKYHLEVLVLRRLLVEDSGVYVCIMNNTVGSQRIEVCRQYIHSWGPLLNEVPKIFSHSPSFVRN